MKLFKLLDLQYSSFTSAVKSHISKSLSKVNIGFGNTTVFGQIINVLNAAIQNIMLYIEDSMIEQNKFTAQRKRSIYALASQSGYQPALGKSAKVQLKINYVPNNYSNLNIIINNHEPLICTQNGLNYSLVLPQEAIVMSQERDNNVKQFGAVQGAFSTQTFTSSGGKYYSLNLKYDGNIDTDYLEVYVNNERYEYRPSLYDMNAEAKQFTWTVSYSTGIDIIFGNGVHGKALKDGDVIKINYLVHDGESGNMDPTVDTYFVFDKPLHDISGEEFDGNGIFNVRFAETDDISSGANAEDTESVRHMIGLNTRSLCLSTPESYKMWINRFSFCGYNRTWSEPGSLLVNSLVIKNYKLHLKEGKDYFKLHEDDFKLSNIQKDSIKNCINNTGNQLAGVTYNIIDPEICKYACYMYIKLKSSQYDQDYIRAKIYQLVGEFFSNINSDMFIPKSDLIVLIKNNIPEIDGVAVYFLSERNENAIKTRHYLDKEYKYSPSMGKYIVTTTDVHLEDGENPNLGLDSHGNILLNGFGEFPVLMGGWSFEHKTKEDIQQGSQTVDIIEGEPLIITFE